MKDLQVFNNSLFGEVRFIEVEGKPYAVANDIAKALGYKNPTDAVKTKCVNIVKYEVENLRGQMRMTNIIPEGDIYRLIIGSKLPQADKFERWVFEEVLPSIRKDGGYIMAKEEDTDEEIMARALLIAQSTIERKNKEIERKNGEIKALENTVTILQPKADYMDNVLSSDKLLTTTSIAKDLGMSAKELNKILNEKGIIYKLGGTWYLYSKYQHMVPEYADYVINEYGQQLKWTEKGRKFIIDILNK